jgi:O-antigen/teichoic acid export membrane protein
VVPSLLAARLLIAAGIIVVTVAAGLLVLPQPDGAVLAAYAFTLVAVAGGTRWVHIGLEQSGRVALARIAGEGLNALLVVLLVRGLDDLGRVPVLQVAGDGIAAVLLLWFLRRAGLRLTAALDWSVVRPVFRRSWPLVLHALLGLLIFNVDFFFLRAYRDSATVGRYAAAYTLISFVLNLGVAYGMSLLPAITRLAGDPPAERALYDGAMAQAFAAALPIAVGGALVATGITGFVFGPGYGPAAAPLRVLLCSLPVALARSVAQAALIARGRQDQVLRSVAWAAVVNIALNFALIPPYGMIGAAAATLITETVRTILSLVYVARLGLPLPPARRFWKAGLAAAAMAGALVVVRPDSLWVALTLGALTYGLALAVTGAVRMRAGGLPALEV